MYQSDQRCSHFWKTNAIWRWLLRRECLLFVWITYSNGKVLTIFIRVHLPRKVIYFIRFILRKTINLFIFTFFLSCICLLYPDIDYSDIEHWLQGNRGCACVQLHYVIIWNKLTATDHVPSTHTWKLEFRSYLVWNVK